MSLARFSMNQSALIVFVVVTLCNSLDRSIDQGNLELELAIDSSFRTQDDYKIIPTLIDDTVRLKQKRVKW